MIALTLIASFYVVGVICAGIDHWVEERPARGWIWIVVVMPFIWVRIVVSAIHKAIAVGILPPSRQPREPRWELERRIEELERDLEMS